MVNPVEHAPAKPGVFAQRVLATLVRSPSRPLSDIVNEILAGASPDLRGAALAVLLRAVQHWYALKGKKGSDAVGQDLSLAERVLVRKNLLNRAAGLVKTRARNLDYPVPPDKLRALFSVLTHTTEEPCGEFLATVCDALDVGVDGEYLRAYSQFLNGNQPFRTPPRDTARAGRLIRWLLRDLEVRFVRFEPLEVCREIPAGRVREEFLRRAGLAEEDVPDLDRVVEEQVDRWLHENGLAGPGWPPTDPEERQKLVGDFWERRRAKEAPVTSITDENRREQALAEEVRSLRERLADLPGLQRSLGEQQAELAALRADRDRLREEHKPLQDQADRLKEESARLREAGRRLPGEREVDLDALREERDRLRKEAARRQEELAQLQGEVARSKEAGLPDWVPAEFRELRALMTLIDEKYPLESLNELVVAGRELEPPVTLRQFVSHLFFALRKRGLAQYPDRDEFDLGYNESALYDCLGFEVAPGATVRVAVRSKGWALRNGRTVIPIRRARVQQA